LRIEQSADDPLFVVEVGRKPLAIPLNRQVQRLAGAEGQGHLGAAGAA
jgi:hypothetical protein